MNGNLIIIQSLNLRHSNLRKFLNIPEVSHFQNEKSELQKELKSVETAKEDLLKESKNLVVVTRQIVELEKLRTEKLFNAEQISKIEQSLAEAKDIKKSIDSEIHKINQRIANPNEIRERIGSRLKALEKILAEDN
jgi:predicted  nucleic acid-binding Zn-ribbon protein